MVSLRAERAFSSSDSAWARSLEFDDGELLALGDPAAELRHQVDHLAGDRRHDVHGPRGIGLDHGGQNELAGDLLRCRRLDGKLLSQERRLGHDDAVADPGERSGRCGRRRALDLALRWDDQALARHAGDHAEQDQQPRPAWAAAAL